MNAIRMAKRTDSSYQANICQIGGVELTSAVISESVTSTLISKVFWTTFKPNSLALILIKEMQVPFCRPAFSISITISEAKCKVCLQTLTRTLNRFSYWRASTQQRNKHSKIH